VDTAPKKKKQKIVQKTAQFCITHKVLLPAAFYVFRETLPVFFFQQICLAQENDFRCRPGLGLRTGNRNSL
jgi:hypothetical protein